MRNIAAALLAILLAMTVSVSATADPRDFRTGLPVPDEAYCDQPYVVVTDDGSWICTMTTGPGHEGQVGQHVAAVISSDRGLSWSDLIDIEPSDGPEASWVVPLLTPYGRIYAFYTYNGDNVRIRRNDVHGWYAFKYSDDGGRTWSARRRLPLRVTDCDKIEVEGRLLQHFWGICLPIKTDDGAYFAFTKLGKLFLKDGEGWLFHSDNILTERDPEKLHWELLPEGDLGIKNPAFGSIQEEHNVSRLSGTGRLVCCYRTTLGFPALSFTSDAGRTWSLPEPMRYRGQHGPVVRNPRACPMLWRLHTGKFLFWYHNNGHHAFNGGESDGSRNLVWLTLGTERDGKLYFAQPELGIYDTNPLKGCSYPGLFNDDGRYFVATTQKTEARILEIPRATLDALDRQETVSETAKRGLLLDLGPDKLAPGPRDEPMPRLPDLAAGGGFTLELLLTLDDLKPGQVLVDSRDERGAGIVVRTNQAESIELGFSDSQNSFAWDVDPGRLEPGKEHHVVFIVDGGPKCVSVVVDGVFCDGAGEERKYGYGRFVRTKYTSPFSDEKTEQPEIADVSGGPTLRIAPSIRGRVERLRLYNRYLLTTEAIGNRRAAD